MPARLSAAIVTYRPDLALLQRTLATLAGAALRAREAGELSEASLFLVDNGPDSASAAVRETLAAWPSELGPAHFVTGHGNVGYGRGNNLVLPGLASDVHLVLNPDVELDRDALAAGLRTLREHPDVGLVAPDVHAPSGEREFLCRRPPTVWVLFLRGFAPAFLRRRFAADLARYEMRDTLGDRLVKGVPIASGCFQLVRTPLFARLGGFDPRYFMYFEDYDFSLRVARESSIAFEPAARIVHHGGGAARKGVRHLAWFFASGFKFFSRHGWRWR
ncbi:hypothetical protein BWI17_08110 [Betaproteobacteria bacterium GR16-43]|nr:hypothetical protein BWI17_08110 [Betaproteobacteria bacterium GR16-43]